MSLLQSGATGVRPTESRPRPDIDVEAAAAARLRAGARSRSSIRYATPSTISGRRHGRDAGMIFHLGCDRDHGGHRWFGPFLAMLSQPPTTSAPSRRSPGTGLLVLLAGLVAVITSCGLLDGGDCTSELGTQVTPASATIAVGEAFTASVALSSCGGRQQLADAITWAVADTAIASVAPATGRVVGLRVGTTTVRGTGRQYGPVAAIPVTVR